MIGCDLYAYIPESSAAGEAVGFSLNSSVNNKCIIIGCRFREVAESGYKQGASIVIDGTDNGGQYIITNNFIANDVRTHSMTGDNYIFKSNITGGVWG